MPATVEENDPSAVVRTVFAALADKRWSEAASYCDPGGAEAFKAVVIERAIQEEIRRTARLREPRDPARIEPDLGTPNYQTRFGVEGIEEVKALAAHDLVARMAAIQDPHGPLSASRTMSRVVADEGDVTTREVIGHVFESTDTAHVVYKRTSPIGHQSHAFFEVLTLRRSGAGWLTTGFRHFQNFWHAFPPD